jgi:hypothetical protein
MQTIFNKDIIDHYYKICGLENLKFLRILNRHYKKIIDAQIKKQLYKFKIENIYFIAKFYNRKNINYDKKVFVYIYKNLLQVHNFQQISVCESFKIIFDFLCNNYQYVVNYKSKTKMIDSVLTKGLQLTFESESIGNNVEYFIKVLYTFSKSLVNADPKLKTTILETINRYIQKDKFLQVQYKLYISKINLLVGKITLL